MTSLHLASAPADNLQHATPARLHHLHVVSDDPARLVAFYQRQLDLQLLAEEGPGKSAILIGPSRAMVISPKTGHTAYSGYAVQNVAALNLLRLRLTNRDVDTVDLENPLYEAGAFSLADPQGRHLAFGVPSRHLAVAGEPARLQHTVHQTTELESVIRFYVDKVGFAISDEVVNDDGTVMVTFMRSDHEHHSLAFFRGSQNEWDHHCYETREWNDIRTWGDRFAEARIPIFFGPGRHGPGRNLFFMVTDPDGNRLEFSAELETVAADATPGVWPHSEYTLNSWGRGWIRT